MTFCGMKDKVENKQDGACILVIMIFKRKIVGKPQETK